MALVLFELGLEAFEQRERVRRRARKSGEHVVVIQPAHLARRGLDHDVAERDLAVAAQCHGAVAAHGKNGGAVEGFHGTCEGRGTGTAARLRYCGFLRKWRGEMPMRSSSARMIGDAPTICTALRCDSTRLMTLSERAGAHEIDALDAPTGRGTTARFVASTPTISPSPACTSRSSPPVHATISAPARASATLTVDDCAGNVVRRSGTWQASPAAPMTAATARTRSRIRLRARRSAPACFRTAGARATGATRLRRRRDPAAPGCRARRAAFRNAAASAL